MQKLPLAATLAILSIFLSILVFAPSVCASDLSTSSSSTHLNDRFLIFDVEGYAILVDASTGAPLSSWTEVSPPFGASPPSSSASSLTDVSIMYPLTPEHEILLLQGNRASTTCCRFESLSFTLMKIATSSISSSVFLNDNRVLQLSGSLVRRAATISDVALTIQQLEINATINTSVIQTHISFIAATSSPVSSLPPSSAMALTEHGGGGRVSLVNDTDGSTTWMLPTSNRLHQAFYVDSDGDLHPVHIFSNWLVGQGLSSMAGGSGSSNNISKLLIAEIASVDAFEHRGRLFCNVQQPQLLSTIQPPRMQPPRASPSFHSKPAPSPSNRHLGIVSAPQLVLAHSDSTMYSPFITNCVMHGDLPLDACIQGFHLVVGTSADPVTWASMQRRGALGMQPGPDESGDNFLLPMLDSVVVQERNGMDVVVVKSKSTRVCGTADDGDGSPQCEDTDAQDNKEWVFPASMPSAPKASDWERRITISLTLFQALGILFVAIGVVVIIWRLRKSKYQLLQAAAVAAALEKQKQEQHVHPPNQPVNDNSAPASVISPPTPSPETTHQHFSLPNFSCDPTVTSDTLKPLSNPHPVKLLCESSQQNLLGLRNPRVARVAQLYRAASESDLTHRVSGITFHGNEVLGKKGAVRAMRGKFAVVDLKTEVDVQEEAKVVVEGKFWKDKCQSSSSSSDSDSLSEWDDGAIPRGGSDDEDSRKEIEFIYFGTADADSNPSKSPAFSDVSTLPRNSSASPTTGTGNRVTPNKQPHRRRMSEADKTEAAAALASSSPPHFTSFDAIFMPSALSSIEAELNEANPKRSGGKALSRDGSGSSSGNTPHSTPKASPQVRSRSSRDTTVSPLPFDVALASGGGGKKRPNKLELPRFERTPTNHYKTTFEEIQPVGQGGFGSVFQVRGRVDNRLYAVKKVKLPNNDAVLKRKMMRETVMMSTLSHVNIVRYHTAWEENVLSSELEPPSNGNDSRSSWGLSASITDGTDRSDPDTGSDNIVPVLFIQMEWCDISVKHWLEKRVVVNVPDVHSMFVQLLMAVHHMHDQGLIHRDIKPDNMFILPSGVLKIGDFGLSVSIRRRLEGSHSSWDGMSSATPMTGSDSSLFFGHLGTVGSVDSTGRSLNKDSNNNALNSSGDDLASLNGSGLSRTKHDVSLDSLSRDTSNVSASHAEVSVVAGTAAYAPPLSTGSFADDLYSVGIVFFELLHLFKTAMHRATCLREIRNTGCVPEAFRDLYPRESIMIEELIDRRPGTAKVTTVEILEKANREFGDVLPEAVKQDKTLIAIKIAGLTNELEVMKRQLLVRGGGSSSSHRSPQKQVSPPKSPAPEDHAAASVQGYAAAAARACAAAPARDDSVSRAPG